MGYKVIELNDSQIENIENRLEQFDKNHMIYEVLGGIKVGVINGDQLIAGAGISIVHM